MPIRRIWPSLTRALSRCEELLPDDPYVGSYCQHLLPDMIHRLVQWRECCGNGQFFVEKMIEQPQTKLKEAEPFGLRQCLVRQRDHLRVRALFRELPPALQWQGSGVTQFRVQFSKCASFAGKKLTFSRRLQGSSYTPKVSEWKAVKNFMGKSKTLYWRVVGKKATGQTVASQPFNFKKK